jgi:hypothetical protein
MVQFNYTHGVWINHMGTNTGYQVQTKLPATEMGHDAATVCVKTNNNLSMLEFSEER